MNDNEFNELADATLTQIETALERSGADLDFAMVSDSVLEIEFADRSKIIVNRHDAAKEIWVAAKSGGFHYRWDGSCWQDPRSEEELMAALSRLISEQAREPVRPSECPLCQRDSQNWKASVSPGRRSILLTSSACSSSSTINSRAYSSSRMCFPATISSKRP